MIPVVVIVGAIFLLLCMSELLWRQRDLDPEYTRKFIHITVGSFVAFWPLFLSREIIFGLSLAFVAVVVVTHYFDLFKAIRSVQRPTWGEVLFAAAVGILAYVAHSGWIYLVALLHMSLADGLAALVGVKFGRSTRYYVFGHAKSVVGTLTFLAVSLSIFAGYYLLTPNPFSWWFVPIALGAAFIENMAVRGIDNLLVPLMVALALNAVR